MAKGQLHKLMITMAASLCALLIVVLPMAAPAYAAEPVTETESQAQRDVLKAGNVLVTVIEDAEDEDVPLSNLNLDATESTVGCGVHYIILIAAGVMAVWMISDMHKQRVTMKKLEMELKNEVDSRKNNIASFKEGGVRHEI